MKLLLAFMVMNLLWFSLHMSRGETGRASIDAMVFVVQAVIGVHKLESEHRLSTSGR